MKIDLHCHTKKVKKGDPAGREVTPEVFRQKIIDADVKIVAITNHNTFDYPQYTALKKAADGICQVWPGIEIDIKGTSKKRWHLIVIVSPDRAAEFDVRIQSLFKNANLNTCSFTIKEVYDAIEDLEPIYVPHFHKEPGISEDELKMLIELVNDTSRVFSEASNHRSLGVLANHGYNALIGSDVKDWNNYTKCSFAELRLPVESFRQFIMLSQRNTTVVKTLLDKKECIPVTAHPHSSVDLELQFYQDINIIFGQKGTGKTEIIKSLVPGFTAKGLSCAMYIAMDRKEDFDALLSSTEMKDGASIMGIDLCRKEFEIIQNWTEKTPTPFERYLEWTETKENNTNKKRMKITEATEATAPTSPDYEKHRADFTFINRIIEDIECIDVSEYLNSAKQKQLIDLLLELKSAIVQRRTSDLIEEYSVQLTNYSINAIKRIADQKSETVSMPSATGLSSFINNRLELYQAVSKILEELQKREMNKKERLGVLEDKGTLYINSKYRVLRQRYLDRESHPGAGIRAVSNIIQEMEELRNHILDSDISEIVTKLVSLCADNNVTSTESFIGYSKQVVLENGDEYNPSNGEQGIIMLQKALSEERDCYLLDEPELGMGSSYIDATILPIIMDLAKRRKYVVVATHNANLAVRTLPYMSIYRTHSNGQYETYTGNPFNDQLVSVTDPTDIMSWTEESLRTLEGSEKAFYERKNIYESKNN